MDPHQKGRLRNLRADSANEIVSYLASCATMAMTATHESQSLKLLNCIRKTEYIDEEYGPAIERTVKRRLGVLRGAEKLADGCHIQ